MIEVVGALIGGLFRLAPEAFKLFGEKADRKHELAMLDRQIALDTLRNEQQLALQAGEQELAQIQGQLANLGEAMRGQFTRTGLKLVDAATWLVRPLTTYLLLALYVSAKIAQMVAASLEVGVLVALIQAYTEEDMALLSGILSFWFVGRTLDKRSGR